MRKISLLNLLAMSVIALSLSAAEVSAECLPGSADPCAPKKVTGEWVTSALFGFNLTQGNTDTSLITAGLKGTLDKDSNLWDLSADYSFGEDDARQDPDNGNTTRNDFRSTIKYDRLVTDRLFFGLGNKFLYDEIADVDYRTSIDPNVGYYLLRDNSFKFKIEGGPSYVFEKVGGIKDDYLAPRIGDRFEWAITCTSKIYQQAEVLLDVSDSDNYIVNAEIGVEAALSTQLALVLTVRETFDNVPAAGREKDDLAVISAIKVSL